MIGAEILKHSNLAELLEGFDKHFENFESSEIKGVLNKLKFKLQAVLKILNFSKTQILYEKNLKIMQVAKNWKPELAKFGAKRGVSVLAESSKCHR